MRSRSSRTRQLSQRHRQGCSMARRSGVRDHDLGRRVAQRRAWTRETRSPRGSDGAARMAIDDGAARHAPQPHTGRKRRRGAEGESAEDQPEGQPQQGQPERQRKRQCAQ
eukprot:Amastigsp_a850832_12.p4 type:complete len:110 gc:universal Amastigsp_a850832_12:441-770(+)